MLDTGPLGQLAHPRRKFEDARWLQSLLDAGVELIIPEIADYELRRNMLLNGMHRSLEVLNDLRKTLTFQPITTPAMLRAAELWAAARRVGQPTSTPSEIDGDVILAAMALESGSIVATENPRHLSRYVSAKDWRLISPH